MDFATIHGMVQSAMLMLPSYAVVMLLFEHVLLLIQAGAIVVRYCVSQIDVWRNGWPLKGVSLLYLDVLGAIAKLMVSVVYFASVLLYYNSLPIYMVGRGVEWEGRLSTIGYCGLREMAFGVQ